jgi:hypothetical protein
MLARYSRLSHRIARGVRRRTPVSACELCLEPDISALPRVAPDGSPETDTNGNNSSRGYRCGSCHSDRPLQGSFRLLPDWARMPSEKCTTPPWAGRLSHFDCGSSADSVPYRDARGTPHGGNPGFTPLVRVYNHIYITLRGPISSAKLRYFRNPRSVDAGAGRTVG